MRVSREQAAENRRRIVERAGVLFREKGFNGIGVADLMKDVGLTHGGFYGHFESKDDLAAQACTHALDSSLARWAEADQADPDQIMAILRSYLSSRHRDHPGSGCAMAALAVDAGRQGGGVRRAFTEGVRPFLEILGRWLPGPSAEEKRQRALQTLSGLVGAVILARAVDDPILSEAFLEAAKAGFLPKEQDDG